MSNNNLEYQTNKKTSKEQTSGWVNLKNAACDFWHEFKRYKYGLVGVALFFIFLLVIIFEPFLIPFPEAGEKWRDITYWENNPKSAAPAWTNWFSGKKRTVHEILTEPEWQVEEVSNMKIVHGQFNYDYIYDLAPSDLIFKAESQGTLNLTFTLVRPDGLEVELGRKTLQSSRPRQLHLSLSNLGLDRAYEFGLDYDDKEVANKIAKSLIKPVDILFARAQKGIFREAVPLKGEYQLKIEGVVMGNGAYLKAPYLIVGGKVFGILGTDNSKRDIWSGIIAGTKWALFIGLLTAAVSVCIGVIYGVASAYYGGWVDSLLMRVFEIFLSIPLLPVLIVLSAIFKPSIWTLIFMMCALYWTGSVKTVRSIGLQIKEETYVEAARALDASNARIIFKHMIPQLIPYAFAAMALRVPVAILVEASISLIGLGDATIVTWGQILHDAFNGGAVLQEIWWWVVPPGVFIALMGMTFAFMGFAMDTILNPKLRTR
ncbi:MAG: ABC transporter permease [Halanaerobium sp.]|nr:ABC transporter permease [Halanaerobium sp.]